MNNWEMFGVLFSASCIPWIVAYFFESKDAKKGCLWIDAGLTIASLVYLAKAGGWWFFPVVTGIIGSGYLFAALGFDPYAVNSDS